ncbi:unnamed protein product, partial [Oppiella nova]
MHQSSDSRSMPPPVPQSTNWSPPSGYGDNRVINIADCYPQSRESRNANQMMAPMQPPITQSQAMAPPMRPHHHSIPHTHPSYAQPMAHPITTTANCELQTTSNILSDIMLSSAQDAGAIVNINLNHRDADKLDSIPVHTQGYPMSTTSSTITMNSSLMSMQSSSLRPMGPHQHPIPVTESQVADASSWPILTQTNHPIYATHRTPQPPPRPTRLPSMSSIMPCGANSQFMRAAGRPPTTPTTIPSIQTLMRTPSMTQMSPMSSHSIPQQMSATQTQITQSRSHQYIPQMNLYPDQIHRNSQMIPNRMPPSTQNYMRSQMQSMRPDANTYTSLTSPDMRQRLVIPANMSPMGANTGPIQYQHTPYPSQRRSMPPSSSQLSHQSMPQMSGRFQQRINSPYDRPHMQYTTGAASPMRSEFGQPLQQQMSHQNMIRGTPRHPRMQYPYPSDGPTPVTYGQPLAAPVPITTAPT